MNHRTWKLGSNSKQDSRNSQLESWPGVPPSMRAAVDSNSWSRETASGKCGWDGACNIDGPICHLCTFTASLKVCLVSMMHSASLGIQYIKYIISRVAHRCMICSWGTNTQRINSSHQPRTAESQLAPGPQLCISLAVFATLKSVADFPITMFRICDPHPLNQAFVDAKPRVVRTPSRSNHPKPPASRA